MDLWRVSIQITLHLIDLINCGALIHTHQSINYKHSDNLTKHEKFKYMAGYDFFFRIKAQVLMWISCSSNFSDRFVVVYQWHHSQVCELTSGFCWISVALPPTHTCAPSSSGSSSSCSLRFTSPTCSAFSCHPTSISSPLISPELQLGQRSPPPPQKAQTTVEAAWRSQ